MSVDAIVTAGARGYMRQVYDPEGKLGENWGIDPEYVERGCAPDGYAFPVAAATITAALNDPAALDVVAVALHRRGESGKETWDEAHDDMRRFYREWASVVLAALDGRPCPECRGERCGVTIAFTSGCARPDGHDRDGLEYSPHLSDREIADFHDKRGQCSACGTRYDR